MLIPRRFRVPLLSICAALLLAAPARAIWTSSGIAGITILTPEITTVNAADVQPTDIMHEVFVGDTRFGTGVVTVSSEGDVTTRKQLGLFTVILGTGNVQSVIGTGRFIVAGGATDNALEFLNSDIDGNGIDVGSGPTAGGATLRVTASKVPDVEVFDGSSAYVTLGSQLHNLHTHTGAYARITDSIVGPNNGCQLEGTVLAEDSAIHCDSMRIDLGGDVEIAPLLTTAVTFDAAFQLKIQGGSLRVANAIATTGSILLGSAAVDLDIGGSHWTNAGGLEIQNGGVGVPVDMDVFAGSHYHDGATVRVAGQSDSQHLNVTGAGTEFEVDGDLRIGEYLFFQQPTDFSGNMTVADGATLIVHGALAIRPLGVLNLEPGGTVYAASLDNQGTINENGGTLVLPEAGAAGSALATIASLVAFARRRTGKLAG